MQIVNIITQYYPSFFKALGITLQMTVISLLCATVLGVIFGLFKVSDFKVLKLIADVYIDIIRGTPLLVQVMIMMYGVGSVLKPYGFQWSNIGGAFTAGCVALSLNAGAYMAEIIRGGIEAVDKGQMEASRSLGLTYIQSMRYVIVPQAIKNILPALATEFISLVKESAIVSFVGVMDIMFIANSVKNSTYNAFGPLLIAALIYFVITFTLSKLVGLLEKKMTVER